MANISLDKFCDTLAMQAPRCPRPALREAVRKAIRTLCDESGIWTLTDTDTVAADGTLDFSYAIGNAEVVEIEAVFAGDRDLEARPAADLDEEYPGWRLGKTYEGEPRYYASIDDDTIQFVPSEQTSITYRLRLIPSHSATEVPDFLYRKFKDVVQDGALYEVLNQRGQEWYDPNKAVQHFQLFESGISKARMLKAKGRQQAAVRVRASYF